MATPRSTSTGPGTDAPRLLAPLLAHVERRLRVEGEAELARADLRPRHLVALTVLRDLGDSTQADLAATLRLDRTNVVGLLNDLEGRGFVERRRAPEDRRRHHVVLTDAGRRCLLEVEAALIGVEDEVLGSLEPQDRDRLHDLLGRVVGAGAVCTEASSPDDC